MFGSDFKETKISPEIIFITVKTKSLFHTVSSS